MNLNWLYTAISFIMLRWHDLFTFLEDRTFLATNWDWVLSIIFLVITVRVILFPLFVKQIKSQRAMQAIQPQMKALQEKHKGDRETLQKEMMELYRKEKANPLMGCLPIFLQVPVFISLFWILGRRLDPNRAWNLGWPDSTPSQAALDASNIELYGWTLDQYGAAAEAKLFNAPIAAVFYEVGWFERDMVSHYAEMNTAQWNVMLVAGTLTLLMVFTTFLTSRQMVLKTGWATDPTQLMMQRLMVYGLPLMLLFSGAFFPISVIIYWVVNNLFSLGQQQWVLRKYPPPPTANKAAAPTKGGPGGRQAAGKSGGKDAKQQDAKPAVDGKKLAPKVGAKPLNAKKVPPRRVPTESIPPRRKDATTGGDAPAKATPAKAAPAKATPAKATKAAKSAKAAGNKATGNKATGKSDPAGQPAKADESAPIQDAVPATDQPPAAGSGQSKRASKRNRSKRGAAENGSNGSGAFKAPDPLPAPQPFETSRGSDSGRPKD